MSRDEAVRKELAQEWTAEEIENFHKQASQPQPEPSEHLIRAMASRSQKVTSVCEKCEEMPAVFCRACGDVEHLPILGPEVGRLRQEFEAYAQGPKLPLERDGLLYADYMTQLNWMTWQASRSAAIQECADKMRATSTAIMCRERLKKLSFLIAGNDYAFFAANPEIEESLKVYVESAAQPAADCEKCGKPRLGPNSTIASGGPSFSMLDYYCHCLQIFNGPSEATTPQAERPTVEAFQCMKCRAIFGRPRIVAGVSECPECSSDGIIRIARAVAPVETPEERE